MAKDQYTKAIEKQMKEQKKQAEEAAIRERAMSVVNGQAIIDGFRIMDKNSEELLSIILEKYKDNLENFVIIDMEEDCPPSMRFSMRFEIEKLKMYGMVSSSINFVSCMHLNLSNNAFSYFEDKEKAQKNKETKQSSIKGNRKEYDLFLSHANADKLLYVDELYDVLSTLGINIFYDKKELSWGDNWKDRILSGTEKSEFAIIVISKQFFDREWTEKELNEFLQRQNESGQKIILPLLYDIDFNDVKQKYPELEFIQSLKTSEHSVENIAILFAKELIKRYK